MKKTLIFKFLLAILVLVLGVFAEGCSNDIEQFDNGEIENSTNERSTFATRSSGNSTVDVDLSRLPNIDSIMTDPIVIEQARQAWAETLSDVLPPNRKRIERGFWVYYDIRSNKIFCSEIQVGQENYNSDNPNNRYIVLTNSRDGEGDSIFVCADFHTHPPLFASPSVATQPVGPSPDDRTDARTKKLPGLVCDYINNVYQEDSVYNETKLWPFGPSKRGSNRKFD